MSDLLDLMTNRVRIQHDPEFALVQPEFIPWTPWNVPTTQAKVALVSTGGVYLKHGLNKPFDTTDPHGDPTFRELPYVVAAADLAIADGPYEQEHAHADMNVIFPLERLHELAEAGYVGAVAPFAYSFFGHVTRPVDLLSNYAPSVAYRMKRMGAEVALVVAVGEVGHQSAAMVARAIELAGVPTILLGTNRELLEAGRAPRAVLVRHPVGAPLGNPGNAGKHQYLLRELFEAAWQLEGPGLVIELPFAWDGG